MLTRPSQPHTITSSSQSTLMATLGGVLCGVIGMLVVTWVLAINRQVQEQTAAITQLGKSVERTTDAQRVALETLVPAAGDAASRNQLIEKYAINLKKLDEQSATNSALANELKRLRDDSSKLEAKLIRSLGFESQAKAAEKLGVLVENLEVELAKGKFSLIDQESVITRLNDAKSGYLWTKYNYAWYLAWAGWIVALLAGLGCLALWALDPTPKAPEPEQVTVRIT